MHRTIQILILLLALVYLGGPLFETVDHWDNFAHGGDDLVLTIASGVAGAGLMLLLGCLLRMAALRRPAGEAIGSLIQFETVRPFQGCSRPTPFTSPPLPLRI